MAKSGLRASLSPLLTRGAGGFISGTISSTTSHRCHGGSNSFIRLWFRSVSDVGTLRNLQLEGSESLWQSSCSSSDEDDAFSELGTPVRVTERVGTVRKLMTEKPEPLGVSLQKRNPARKASRATRMPSDDVFAELGTLVGVAQRVRMAPKLKNKNLKSSESVESYRRAVSVGKVALGRLHLPIQPLHVSGIAVIRISNMGANITDLAIHSTCMSYGPLEGLVRKEEDVVDAFFALQDDLEVESILGKLNSTAVNGCRWSARLRPPRVDLTKGDGGDARRELGSEISRRVVDLKGKIHAKRIYSEDLECLHSCIVHLESHPASVGDDD